MKRFFLTNRNILIFLILIISAVLRLYNLAGNPPAAYGDEISFSWNAWNILKTGTDEYGSPFPLQFRAFDDYKAPLPVYLLVPLIKLFGLNTWSVRLLVVVFSILTVLVIYVLGKRLVNSKFGLIASLLLTISPWHIQLSRGFFESTIALFWFILGIYLLIRSQSKVFWVVLSALSFSASLYTYFTPRIILPLFLPLLILWYRKYAPISKKRILIFIGVLFMVSLPLLKLAFFEKGTSRLEKIVSMRNQEVEREVIADRANNTAPELVKMFFHNKMTYWMRDIKNSYLEHFSLNFMYLYGDSSLRYFLGNMGMFYLIEAPFLSLGVLSLYKVNRSVFWLLVGWLAISPIPAAISGRPFAVRSLTMVPAIYYFVSMGLIKGWEYLRTAIFGNILKVAGITLFVVSLGLYLARYHFEYPVYGATWWGWENKAAIDYAIKNQEAYDQIYLSNFYSGMDLAFAFYTKQDPISYRFAKDHPVQLADNRSFIRISKYYIGSLDLDKVRLEKKLLPPRSLYIGRPEEADGQEVISDPFDGRILFKIYKTH